MRNAEGYSIITMPGERAIEHDTSTCGHCNAISFTKPAPRAKPQVLVYRPDGSHYLRDIAFCRNCWRYICPRCERKRECVPLERKLEIEEAGVR